MVLKKLNSFLRLAGFLAATVTVCVSVQHQVKWSFAGVANYSVNSPLMVVLGDVVTFECVVPPSTNIIYQTNRSQYDECDVGAASSQSRRVGVCISAVGFGLSNLSIDIQKTARLLQSGLQYEPGKMYYFTSYSTGSDLSTTVDQTKGGQCNDGLKMAISVAPQPVFLTSSPLPSPALSPPRNEGNKGNSNDGSESNTLIVIGAAVGAGSFIFLVCFCFLFITCACAVKWNRQKRSGVAIKNDEQEKSVEMGINGQFISLQTDVGDRGKKEIQVNGVGGMKKSSNDGRSHSRIRNGKTNAMDDDKIDTRDAKETKVEKKERKNKQMQRQEKQNEAEKMKKERKEREEKERQRREREITEIERKENEKKERENKEREKKETEEKERKEREGKERERKYNEKRERENKEREEKEKEKKGKKEGYKKEGGAATVQTSEKAKRVASKNTKKTTTDSNTGGAHASHEINRVAGGGKSKSLREGRQNRSSLSDAQGPGVTTLSQPPRVRTHVAATRSSSTPQHRPPPPPPDTRRDRLANVKAQNGASKVKVASRRPPPSPPVINGTPGAKTEHHS